MDILPSGNIFRELQVVHDTGYLSAQTSLEDHWEQVCVLFLFLLFWSPVSFGAFFETLNKSSLLFLLEGWTILLLNRIFFFVFTLFIFWVSFSRWNVRAWCEICKFHFGFSVVVRDFFFVFFFLYAVNARRRITPKKKKGLVAPCKHAKMDVINFSITFSDLIMKCSNFDLSSCC